MLFTEVQSHIEQKCKLLPERLTLAGVSGGPDSLCLADVMRRLGYSLVIAHFDHQLRPSSSADADCVRAQAARWGIEVVCGGEDVAAFAAREGRTIEEAARILRYRFLLAQAERLGAQAVAVGHTADDQVETVLMHLLRGAGLAGLGGMAFSTPGREWGSEIPIVRPLLKTWRAETVAYCRENGLHPVDDPTNQDPQYYRNRLRRELVPFLETFNAQARQAVWRMAELARGDYDTLQEHLRSVYAACGLTHGAGYAACNYAALRALSPALQRHLLRQAAALARPGLADVDFNAIERGLEFIAHPTRSGEMDWIGGMTISLEGDRLWIAAAGAVLPAGDWPQIHKPCTITLADRGRVELDSGWALEYELSNAPGSDEQGQPGGMSAVLDADRVGAALEIRPRLPGERFQPEGMEGHSLKLSDFMINARLPRRARAAWPLVCAAGQIAWAPGYRRGHGFAVTPATQRFLRLRVVRVG